MSERGRGPRRERDAADLTDAELRAAVVEFLASEPTTAPDHLLAATLERRRASPQRSRGWRRFMAMGRAPLAAGLAAAVVVVVATIVVGLPFERNPVAGSPDVPASPTAGRPPSVEPAIHAPVRIGSILTLDAPGLAVATDGGRGWALRAGSLVPFTVAAVAEPVVVDLEEPREITADAGQPWATGAGGALITIDPASGQVRRIGVGIDGDLVATGGGTVWVAGLTAVRRLDVASGDLTTLPISGVVAMAPAGDLLWTVRENRTIVAVDGATGRETFVLPRPADLGRPAASIAAAGGSIWAIDPGDGTQVLRIDPSTGEISGTVALGLPLEQLAVGSARLWALSQRTSVLATVDLASLGLLETASIPGNVSDLDVLADRPLLLELQRLLVVDSR